MTSAQASAVGTRRYGLSVERRFHEELIGLPRDAQKRVLRALAEMQDDPAHRSKPLQGAEGTWRREVAPYRILFRLAPGWIHVFAVQHRQGVYQGRIAAPSSAPATGPPAFEVAPQGVSVTETVAGSPSKPGLTWDTVGKAVLSRKPDDLYELIDLGLPESLFDQLVHQLAQQESRPGVPRIRLVRHRVIDAFFGPLMRLGPGSIPLELTLITPWITPWSSHASSLSGLIRFINSHRIPTVLITRTPQFPSHQLAVDQLKSLDSVEIITIDDLHAKFFIAEIPPIPIALLGSANSTARSIENVEVGVSIQGAGDAETLVHDLQSLAIELRGLGSRIKKRRT
jgi:mRNA-degrading endonuclease RelE of RelBE toxin-antitoxin system